MRFGLFSFEERDPASDFDPAEHYDRLLARIVAADQLGFATYWLSEHHFGAFGLNPSPQIVLAAAARLTRRIRLGVGVSVLPLRHPVEVAEEYAIVDALSAGRLDFGVGSGAGRPEFAALGVPYGEKADRLDESLDLILRAWRGERISVAGRFTTLQDVWLPVRPVQRPHPPVWVAVFRPEAAYHVGRRGRWIVGLPFLSLSRLSDVADLTGRFRAGYAEAGHDPATARVPMVLPMYVGETDTSAEAVARPAFARFFHATGHPPRRTWRELLASQLVAVGGPDSVADCVCTLRDAGANEVLGLLDFGGLPPAEVHRSMERLAREVAPRFAGAG